MPMYLDTRGRSKLSIAICGRCSQKFPYDELVEDPNSPGLLVCTEDRDQFDPWRLPARGSDDITLQHPRPDVSLTVGPQQIAINQIQAVIGVGGVDVLGTEDGAPIAVANAVTQLNPSNPWSANTAYGLGAQITASNPVGLAAAGNLFYLFTCIIPGTSGSSAPSWPTTESYEVADGSVLWINTGLYLP